MTEEIDIKALRALHSETRQGIWTHEEHVQYVWDFQTREIICMCEDLDSHEGNCANAAFIAAAHRVMPALLDEIERLRAMLSEAKADSDAHGATSNSLVSECSELRQERSSMVASIQSLTAWKSSAEDVFALWDECHAAAGRPGRVGESSAVATKREILRLKAIEQGEKAIEDNPVAVDERVIRERLLQEFNGEEAQSLGATTYRLKPGEHWQTIYDHMSVWCVTNGPGWLDGCRYRLYVEDGDAHSATSDAARPEGEFVSARTFEASIQRIDSRIMEIERLARSAGKQANEGSGNDYF